MWRGGSISYYFWRHTVFVEMSAEGIVKAYSGNRVLRSNWQKPTVPVRYRTDGAMRGEMGVTGVMGICEQMESFIVESFRAHGYCISTVHGYGKRSGTELGRFGVPTSAYGHSSRQ